MIHAVGSPTVRMADARGHASNRVQKWKFLTGLTLVELMVATVLSLIVITGIGIILADSQRGWNAMYNRTYSDVVTFNSITKR